MIDWEKMASGLLYDANFDPALLEARARAQDLCMDYNQLRSTQKAERLTLLRSLLASCGEDIVIEPPLIYTTREDFIRVSNNIDQKLDKLLYRGAAKEG